MNKRELNKWHHQMLEFYVANDWIEVDEFSKQYVRIKRLRDDLTMDFWPSTGKAKWNIKDSIYFTIKYLDLYLDQKFL